jgi:transforming growth factor-beta-induced protein
LFNENDKTLNIMKKRTIQFQFKKAALVLSFAFTALLSAAQTNVYDNVIATSPNHTSLNAAIVQQNLQGALQNPAATLTVFAPDNTAFDNLATALGTDITGLLALPNLTDILLYHVLGITVDAASVTNGAIVNPLNASNTIKMTKTSMGGDVFANQAQVNAADLTTGNGIVHSVDAVLLPYETVVDVAIDNGFTYLTAAVIQAELLPALTNPLATLTVFAPDNASFDNLATALSTDINGLLALPNLSDILLYHVLGTTVDATAVTNGAVVTPLSPTNTLKMTKTSMGEVFANQAEVVIADLTVDNGIVHAINAVLLPFETVVDIAIDNGFTSLTAAVATAELLPALTNPLAALTVFAPDNTAFDNLAAALGTDIAGLLASPILSDILLYHVVGSTVLSGALMNGPVGMLNGEDVIVDLTNGVMINTSTVLTADLTAANGVVHVIDIVLLPLIAGIEEADVTMINVAPNPATDVLKINDFNKNDYKVMNIYGETVLTGSTENGTVNVSELANGNYFIFLTNETGEFQAKFIKL